jgi:hypothetical protein
MPASHPNGQIESCRIEPLEITYESTQLSSGYQGNLEASVRSRDTDDATRCGRELIEAGLN